VIGKTLMLASIGIATGTVASFMIPTRRASRIHPMIALRNS
jgi:ABC-type antimicrobial peptide transport system permease subunit